MFSLLTTSIILSGSLVSHFEKYLPSLFIQAIRYGKFAYTEKTSKSKIVLEVPKSWFKHFYWVGVSIFTFTLYTATSVYIFNADVNVLLIKCLNILCGTHRQSKGKNFSQIQTALCSKFTQFQQLKCI